MDAGADRELQKHSYLALAAGVCGVLAFIAAAYFLWAGARNDVPTEYVAGGLLVGLMFLAFGFNFGARARAADQRSSSRFLSVWHAIFYGAIGLLTIAAAFPNLWAVNEATLWAVIVCEFALILGVIAAPAIAAFLYLGRAGRRAFEAGSVALATYVIGYGAAILYPERTWIFAVAALASFPATVVFLVYFTQAWVPRLNKRAAASDK